jgi:histidinol-phosphate aminotransferase
MLRREFVHTGLALGTVGLGDLSMVTGTCRAAPARKGEPLRLNSNENPLGLSPAARSAVIEGIGEANRYPRESRDALRNILASHHGVKPEQIVFGAGSTEVLQMMVQAHAMVGGTIVLADPTFEDVPTYAGPFAAHIVKVPLDDRYRHDVARMRQAAQTAQRPVLVYICNPNNPTGTVTPCQQIDDWIAERPTGVRFLIDEAYFEYVDDRTYWPSVRWVAERPDVVVVRTFSKIHGMAGMRLGYGIAHPDTAELLSRYISKNSVSHLAHVAARASLGDRAHLDRAIEANRRGTRILQHTLDELGLEHLPTHTNFLMHRVPGDLDGYIARMREHGVKVGRPFPPMTAFNRVSIGTPAEMEQFAAVLRAFRKKGWV